MKKILVLLLLCWCSGLLAQEESIGRSGRKTTIGFNAGYHYRSIHNALILARDIEEHQVFFGTEYITLLEPFGNPLNNYSSHTIGMHVGYRNYFYQLRPDLGFYGQFAFSFYPVSFRIPVLGNEKNTTLTIENTLSVGAEYRLRERFYVFSTAGIGSLDGWFLVRGSFFGFGNLGFRYWFVQPD
jgi:hypothetical protein